MYGDQGNIILLSQSFDDTAVLNQFRPPQGTEVLEWTNDLDEVSRDVSRSTNNSHLHLTLLIVRLDLCMEKNSMKQG